MCWQYTWYFKHITVEDKFEEVFEAKHPCQLLQEFLQYKKYEEPIYNFKEEKSKNNLLLHVCNLHIVDLKMVVETSDANKKNAKSNINELNQRNCCFTNDI